MKQVLVVYFSQSGQLTDIVRNICEPFNHNEVELNYHEIKMKAPFPFPWDKKSFFDAFPESHLLIPAEIEAIDSKITEKRYDLIILAYQVWFLSISIPVNSFLQTKEAGRILENTPVITVIGCRNMWLNAQEKMKSTLLSHKAQLVGNIVLIDRAPNLISVVTIVKWMFTGEKKKYLNIFPLPGVSDSDINSAKRFGETINEKLINNDFVELQSVLVNQGAVEINSYLVSVEKKASKIFEKWAKLILRKNKKRPLLLRIFNVYLFAAIWFISPLVYIIYILTYPLSWQKRKQQQEYYKGIL